MTYAYTAQQGHKYALGDRQVIAMQSGSVVIVRPINESEPWPLGESITVKASWLQPVGMKYFYGDVPK